MPVYRISPRIRQGGIDWQFDMWVDTAAGDPTVPGALVNTAVENNLLPILPTDATYLGCQVSDPVGKTIAGQFVHDTGLPPGTEGAVGLPPVVCYTVSLYDGIYGRGRTGRWFISSVPIDVFDGGVLLDASVTAFQTAWDAFFAEVNGGAGQVSIYSKKDGTSYPVFRVAVQPTLREQRRREFGRSIKH